MKNMLQNLKLPFIIATAILFTATSCKKENTPENQANSNNPAVENLVYLKKTRPILFEFTSTGCFGCGQWGKPTFASLIEGNTDIIPLAVHIKYGDPMITEFSTQLGQNRHGSLFTPQLWVNDSNAVVLQGNGIQGQQSIERANYLIETSKPNITPTLAANFKIVDNKVEVNFGTQFIDFQEDGEYFIACYLTEDKISFQQSGYSSNPAQHNHVIRDAANGTYGYSFTKADLMKNKKEWSHTFELLPNFNVENLYSTIIVWKKVNNRYQALNGFVAK